jgi:type IV pilus assembly protein PilV
MSCFLIAPYRKLPSVRRSEAGFSMLEVLISVFIVLLGLLGLAGLIVRSNQTEMESYQRVQGLMVVQDMVDRINANRKVASCYSNGTTGITLGTGASAPATCASGTTEQNARANADLTAWNGLLLGSAEVSSVGSNIGAMISARGCITYDATTEVAGVAGTGVYTVTVVWQGLAATASSANTCGQGLYTDDTLRRVVTSNIRIGGLGV